MKIRHGAWYETYGGHAVFITKTRGERTRPIQGFVVTTISGARSSCTWKACGTFDWGCYHGLDIKGRWPYAKPKWCKISKRYMLPKLATRYHL